MLFIETLKAPGQYIQGTGYKYTNDIIIINNNNNNKEAGEKKLPVAVAME